MCIEFIKQLTKILINMRHLFYTVFMVMLVSCTPNYQLITLQTTSPELADNNYVFQDSLVKITYDFYSPNGVINFKIYNKSNAPIFIDWKNSLFIKSVSEKYNYWTDEAKIEGTLHSSSSSLVEGIYSGSGSINGNVKKDERITFLPPNTEIIVGKYKISNSKKFICQGTEQILLEDYSWKKSLKQIKIKDYKYSIDNTPINFRNYLTISKTEDFTQPLYYDFGFWISNIKEMKAPQLVGDSFYQTYVDSISNTSNYHPYKKVNRFFIKDR